MKLYTRSGDTGRTTLIGRGSVPKNDVHLEALGSVDEVAALVGFAEAACTSRKCVSRLRSIQETLCVVGGQLASATIENAPVSISDKDVLQLEAWIDELEAQTPQLKNFILVGGTELAVRLHLARTCCRRAERAIVGLASITEVPSAVLAFMNRLSDLLFAFARYSNHSAAVDDVVWKGRSAS